MKDRLQKNFDITVTENFQHIKKLCSTKVSFEKF